jgi:hypothetical protein
MDRSEPAAFFVPEFQCTLFWSRSKPKEPFNPYPGAERSRRPVVVLNWVEWNHLQQACALAGLVVARQVYGDWPPDRLLPLRAGLVDLEPWLHQWHNDPDPLFGGSPAAFITGFLDQQRAAMGATRQDAADWGP